MNLSSPVNHITNSAQPVDFVSLSKVITIELAFLGSVTYAILGHPGPDILQFCEVIAITTGSTLGILRLGDIFGNIINIKNQLTATLSTDALQTTRLQAGTPPTPNNG